MATLNVVEVEWFASGVGDSERQARDFRFPQFISHFINTIHGLEECNNSGVAGEDESQGVESASCAPIGELVAIMGAGVKADGIARDIVAHARDIAEVDVIG